MTTRAKPRTSRPSQPRSRAYHDALKSSTISAPITIVSPIPIPKAELDDMAAKIEAALRQQPAQECPTAKAKPVAQPDALTGALIEIGQDVADAGLCRLLKLAGRCLIWLAELVALAFVAVSTPVVTGVLFVVFMLTVYESWGLLKPVADAMALHATR